MIPPETQNGPGGSRHSRQGQYDQKAAEDISKIARRTDKRHVPGQLPIVLSATAYPPAWGTVTTLVVLDQECMCGDWHNHKVKGNAPALLNRKARCGNRYELALHPPRVRRSRRAA
jgi:hypothetical protein